MPANLARLARQRSSSRRPHREFVVDVRVMDVRVMDDGSVSKGDFRSAPQNVRVQLGLQWIFITQLRHSKPALKLIA